MNDPVEVVKKVGTTVVKEACQHPAVLIAGLAIIHTCLSEEQRSRPFKDGPPEGVIYP